MQRFRTMQDCLKQGRRRSVAEPPGGRGWSSDQLSPRRNRRRRERRATETPHIGHVPRGRFEAVLKALGVKCPLRGPHAGESGVSRKVGPISLSDIQAFAKFLPSPEPRRPTVLRQRIGRSQTKSAQNCDEAFRTADEAVNHAEKRFPTAAATRTNCVLKGAKRPRTGINRNYCPVSRLRLTWSTGVPKPWLCEPPCSPR